ncbi:MAG TPA: Maf family protein [Capsulimonadaceae bacterium]|jgi:septum formation protein
MSIPKFILASGSPRRRELLGTIGIDFDVVVSVVDEAEVTEKLGDAPPSLIVTTLAEEKALEVAARTPGKALVLGADTVVVLDEHVLGKPENEDHAVAMLMRLSGREHQVYTGIALVAVEDGVITKHRSTFSVTGVEFAPFSEDRARAYVVTGEPMDKAGSYGIQALGTLLIPRIDGDYFNVVGLPVFRLGEMLKEFGVDLL